MSLRAKLAFVAASVSMLPVAVYAAVPEDVTTALTAAKTDATTVGTAVLGVIIAIFALLMIRKALR